MILRHVTIDCADPYRFASFRSEVTGWPVSGEDKPGEPEVLIEAPSPVPGLLFIQAIHVGHPPRLVQVMDGYAGRESSRLSELRDAPGRSGYG